MRDESSPRGKSPTCQKLESHIYIYIYMHQALAVGERDKINGIEAGQLGKHKVNGGECHDEMVGLDGTS